MLARDAKPQRVKAGGDALEPSRLGLAGGRAFKKGGKRNRFLEFSFSPTPQGEVAVR